MTFDPTKLTPMPIRSVGPCKRKNGNYYVLAHNMQAVAYYETEADCDFAEVSRKAYAAMQLGYTVVRREGKPLWKPKIEDQNCPDEWFTERESDHDWFPCPFAALAWVWGKVCEGKGGLRP